MPIGWLPEDDTHPVRPDLPVVRHLTFTEAHALEIGGYVGVLSYFGVHVNMEGAVFLLLLSIARFVVSDGRASAGATTAVHRMGFHDVRKEPQYFGATVLVAFVLMVVLVDIWSALGLGAIGCDTTRIVFQAVP